MYGMFSCATSFNASLTTWNVSRVEEMDYMFWKAASFIGNLSGWRVNPVVLQHRMFSDATPVVVDPMLEPRIALGGEGVLGRGAVRV